MDLPAVSGPNGKVEAFYGAVNRSYLRGSSATFSMPAGHDFGVQLDALYARAFETDLLGAGGHFFKRDPSHYLLGLAAGVTHSSHFNDILAGIEGELYYERLTIGAFVGYNHFDSRLPVGLTAPLNQEKHFAVARVYASLYPVDNLMLTTEWQNRFGKNIVVVGLEYQTPARGVTVYLDGGLGDNNFRQLIGGIRIYFGGDKSLKHRHRQDDPASLVGAFAGTTVSGAPPAQGAQALSVGGSSDSNASSQSGPYHTGGVASQTGGGHNTNLPWMGSLTLTPPSSN